MNKIFLFDRNQRHNHNLAILSKKITLRSQLYKNYFKKISTSQKNQKKKNHHFLLVYFNLLLIKKKL